MSDRRRINGPAGNTHPTVFANSKNTLARPHRQRKINELRRIFLKTGLVPSASGSAYLELETPSTPADTFIPTTSTIKLSCSVHGPKPLPRNASFSPNLQLSASIKFAPFSTRQRRGFVRDSTERDLGTQLENALKGVIIPDRWPKSSIEVAITVLEGEEDGLWAQVQGEEQGVSGVGLMNVLSGSITVATAALLDAGIDCLDLLTGGVAAYVKQDGSTVGDVLDPCPSEHEELISACAVAYLPSRDEVAEIWCKGSLTATADGTESFEKLVQAAIKSARGSHLILTDALRESTLSKQKRQSTRTTADNEVIDSTDVRMEA